MRAPRAGTAAWIFTSFWFIAMAVYGLVQPDEVQILVRLLMIGLLLVVASDWVERLSRKRVKKR